ncbi:ABC transporter permease subunit [Candidatus Poribacteria bacterium]|nr:ABC transporter permease subunit [Candidatus Poribacteria bacterium]MYH80374.1 ABC transporter permease subunit [Candidatus Poribacteria bacterium]MYK92544.1 ABC transporter permease subunit [Candidatus Poribacteria bacterium]
MIWHIIKRELYDHLNSLRFAFTTVLLIILMLINAVGYLDEYKTQSTTYQKKVSASLDKMRSQTNNLYNLLIAGPGNLYKKPFSLSFCASSGEGFIPESAEGGRAGWSIGFNGFSAKGLWRMKYPQSNPNLWDIMPDYRNVDWADIISIVLSLIAILFTFDTISSEQERGTLRLTLSNSISRGTVLVSKFLAALITISIPFLIAALINLFLLYSSGSTPLGPSEWGRLGVIVLIAFVYVSIFLALGLLISSHVSHSSTSLTILLLIWVVWIALLPSTLGALTSGLQPTMTSDELNARRENLRQNLDEQYGNRWSKTASRDIPATEGTLLWSKYLTEDAKRNEELNEEHLDTQIAQIQLARSITRISPASSVRYTIESLAGTGFSRHVQFLAHARRYANEFSTFLIETDRIDPESPHALGPKEGTSQKPVSFESIPKFEDRISFSGAYTAAATDILLLLLFFVVLFAGAFLSFLRVDV